MNAQPYLKRLERCSVLMKDAGLDAQHNAEIQPPRIWVNNETCMTETPPA